MFYCENVTEWEQELYSRQWNARHLIAGLDLCIVCVLHVSAFFLFLGRNNDIVIFSFLQWKVEKYVGVTRDSKM